MDLQQDNGSSGGMPVGAGRLRTANSCAGWALGALASVIITAGWYPALILAAPAATLALALQLAAALRRNGATPAGTPVRPPAWQAAWDVLLVLIVCVAALATFALSGLGAWGLRPPSSNAESRVFPFMGALAYVSAACILVGLLWPVRARAGSARRTAARLVLIAGWLGLLLALGLPVHLRDVVSARKAVCLGHTKELALALQMYADDNDQRLPLAANWQDALEQYCKGSATFTCPEAPGSPSAYAYSSTLPGLAYSDLLAPGDTVGIFESDAGPNAVGGPELLPDAPRHYGGDNYGFPDGHAAWIGRAPADLEMPRRQWVWLKETQKPVTWEP